MSNSLRIVYDNKVDLANTTLTASSTATAATAQTYGHTGFTGTCTWVDPAKKLVYVFLSNRVNPQGDNQLLLKMNVRTNIQEAIYKVIAENEKK